MKIQILAATLLAAFALAEESHNQPLVSVVMTSYNLGNNLTQSIESVKNQDYTNWELIIVDDNSDDKATVKALNYYESHPQIRIIRRDVTHYLNTQARNIGTREAKGEYIAYIDDETMAQPNHLSNAVKIFQKNPKLDMIAGPIRLVDWKNEIL
jgi:glycosyltransferase involved in cell wall biosynthesis